MSLNTIFYTGVQLIGLKLALDFVDESTRRTQKSIKKSRRSKRKRGDPYDDLFSY